MADELQKTYREYGKRKRSAFRASVKKAYSIVLRSYGVDDKDSSDEELLSDSDGDSEDDKFVSSASSAAGAVVLEHLFFFPRVKTP